MSISYSKFINHSRIMEIMDDISHLCIEQKSSQKRKTKNNFIREHNAEQLRVCLSNNVSERSTSIMTQILIAPK